MKDVKNNIYLSNDAIWFDVIYCVVTFIIAMEKDRQIDNFEMIFVMFLNISNKIFE